MATIDPRSTLGADKPSVSSVAIRRDSVLQPAEQYVYTPLNNVAEADSDLQHPTRPRGLRVGHHRSDRELDR